MNSFTTPSAQQLRRAADLKERLDALQDQLSEILGSGVLTLPEPTEPAKKKRRMSAAGRRAIAAAARARWARYNAAKGATKQAKKTKKKFSAAGRAALAAAARARWAKAKAAGKSRL